MRVTCGGITGAGARRFCDVGGNDGTCIADECGSSTPVVLAGTQRQQEIIALAAAGLTNRQIAARLVMSVRTVEGTCLRIPARWGQLS